MNRFLAPAFFFISILVSVNSVYAQLTVDGSLTPQQLVQTVLIGNGVSASNVTYSGAAIAIGSFNSNTSNIGLPSGILLTTGDISGNEIYNRWGRKVFENNDYKNDWDGEKFAEGVYFYILTVLDPEQGTKTGHVTIIRD